MPQKMMTKDSVPTVEWIPCGNGLPEEGKFVWVVVGRCVEAGEARRYIREVHMGTYRGEDNFEIFPYTREPVSNEVWAWAPIMRPVAPVCRRTKHEQ